MGFGRKAGCVHGVWCLILLAGAAVAMAAATTTGGGTTATTPSECVDNCYRKFFEGGGTEDEFWKCIEDCADELNHGVASRGIRHAATRAIVRRAAICYEKYDGKSQEELDKCVDDFFKLNHAIIRAIRQVV